jgi:hypothetical protein
VQILTTSSPPATLSNFSLAPLSTAGESAVAPHLAEASAPEPLQVAPAYPDYQGFMVCNWYHLRPQLFWLYHYNPDYPMPTNCALVALVAEEIPKPEGWAMSYIEEEGEWTDVDRD